MDADAIAWEVADKLLLASRRLVPEELHDVLKADVLIAAAEWAICMNEVPVFIKVPLQDGPIPVADYWWSLRVREASRAGHALWQEGLTTVVQCGGGFNRSGLIAARILMFDGYDAGKAIRAVREARGPDALSNPYFVEWLRREELDGE